MKIAKEKLKISQSANYPIFDPIKPAVSLILNF